MQPLRLIVQVILRRQKTVAALSIYLLLAAIFYAPLLLGMRTFPDGDFTHHFFPFSFFHQQEWLAGRVLPVWNPYTYSGHPFLADVQAAVFYPLGDLLLLLTLPFPSPAARLYFLQVEAILHVALAGFFTFLLVRALTANWWAGLFSGVLFAFSGYLTGYPPLQLAILRTAIWLPLILWLLLRAFAEPQRWRWWIGAALAWTTALLAGHPQTFLHLSYTVAAWIVLLLAATLVSIQLAILPEKRASPPRRHDRRSSALNRGQLLAQQFVGLVVVLVLAVAISAAQLLPSVEFTRHSVRANVEFDFVSGGLSLADTWQMFFPGTLTDFSPLYVGIVAWLLIPFSLIIPFVNRWRSRERVHPSATNSRSSSGAPHLLAPTFFVLLTLLALFIAYGRNSFLYPLLYRFAPGWDLFRQQERAAYLVAFGLSVLAGLGMTALPLVSARVRRFGALGMGFVIGAGGIVFLVTSQPLAQTPIGYGDPAINVIVSLVLAAVTVALLWQPHSERRTMALLVLAVLNLFFMNVNAFSTPVDPARKTALLPEMEALQAAVDAHTDAGAALPGRVYNEYRVYENYGMRLGIEETWGSSPLRLARYDALFQEFPLDRAWRLTAVDHVLTWRQDLFEPSERLAAFPQATDTTYLHRLTLPNPRAWLTHRVRLADDDEALALLADHDFDLNTTALLSADQADRLGIDADVTLSEAGASSIEMTRRAPHRLSVTVESEHGGLLLISENWLPGWRVENATCASETTACLSVDEPLRADLFLLAVPVPPGAVMFDLRYWPQSLRLGLLLSGAAILLLVVSSLWHRRRRSRNIQSDRSP